MHELGVKDVRHHKRTKGVSHKLPEGHAPTVDKRFHKGRLKGKVAGASLVGKKAARPAASATRPAHATARPVTPPVVPPVPVAAATPPPPPAPTETPERSTPPVEGANGRSRKGGNR